MKNCYSVLPALAIREFNGKLAQDDRIDLSLIAIAEGLTLARKHN